MYEDGFANERSGSRISDYTGSNGGDLFRSGVQSPNFQKDIGSPSSETPRDFSGEVVVNHTGSAYSESYARRDTVTMPCLQVLFLTYSSVNFDRVFCFVSQLQCFFMLFILAGAFQKMFCL